jgi:energy-coupling factor transporter ATP-binding protein EcfA2
VSVGYYAQEHENIRAGVSLLEHIQEHRAGTLSELRGLLGMFGLTGEKVFQEAGTLSGGEKTKLALSMLMVGRNNVLLLDEPTNNLDPGSRQSVADSLSTWPGALILVSHDTEFVQKLAPNRVLLMPDGALDDWTDDLLDLVAHEMYPGHHTEHILKEERFAAFAYPTPQALIAEGIAMLALDQLLGAEAHAVGAGVLRPLGIGYDEEVVPEVVAAQHELLPVRANLAMRLDAGSIDTDGGVAYARRWLPEPDPYAEKIVQRLRSEPWTPYESCYPEGLAVCRAFCEREPDGYRRLLTGPLTTEDVL